MLRCQGAAVLSCETCARSCMVWGARPQVFLPLAPGIESISEPAMEEVGEALDAARENVDQLQTDVSAAAHRVDRRIVDWVKRRRK